MPLKLTVQKGNCPPLCLFVEFPIELLLQAIANAGGGGGEVAGASFGAVDTIELASASRLVDVQTAPLPDSTVFAVRSVQDLFQLIKSPSVELFTAADGITIAQSVANPGQIWVRLGLGSERWRTQPTWFVDPVSGHDENVGSQASPLETFREFSRRIDQGEIRMTIDVTLTSDAGATDKLYLNNVSILPDAMIRVHGQPTTLDSGTFTATTNLNAATQTPPSVTDAAQDFSAYLNRRMRIVGGARDGAIAFISLVTAATTVRTSAWATNNVAGVPYSPAVVLVNPVAGDAYVIEDLPILRSFDFEGSKTAQGTQGSEAILFESLQIGDSSNDRFQTGQSNTSIAKCVVSLFNFYGRDVHAQLCNFNSNHTWHMSELTLRACLKRGGTFTLHHGATVFLRDQTLAQSAGQILDVSNGSYVQIFDAAAFDCTDGLFIESESAVRFSGVFWGNNNTEFGIQCDGRATYDTLAVRPTCTGALGDTEIGGTIRAYGTLPYVELANLAMIVERPTV